MLCLYILTDSICSAHILFYVFKYDYFNMLAYFICQHYRYNFVKEKNLYKLKYIFMYLTQSSSNSVPLHDRFFADIFLQHLV